MSKINITLETFGNLLKELDNMLMEASIRIKIKAIGGFAMMYHANQYEIKGREKSSDIDSLEPISDKVIKMISLIGEKNLVECDWLNNDWLRAKKGMEELEYFAQWYKCNDFHLKMIDLYIMDIETMFFFKMRAVNEKLEGAEEPPRQQDIRDLFLIMKMMDETDIYHIHNVKMSSCIEYFPMARDYMSGREPRI